MDLNDSNLSLLAYPDPQDFDYTSLLQSGEELDFHQPTPQQQFVAPATTTSTASTTLATTRHHHNPFAFASQAPHSPPIIPGLAALSDSSAGRATPPSPDGSKTSGDLSQTAGQLQLQKQRLERRGHTKSRRGCYNCKRRRIKVSLASPNPRERERERGLRAEDGN